MADLVRVGRLIINLEQVCAAARSQSGDEVVVFINGKGPRDTGHFVISGADAEKLWTHLAQTKAATVLSEE